ncbi:MAG: hypothetical protein KF799_08935 [Bdellovibrionales bacterium]|nr:hypothetical protein [Bdellovibrionales bacterium]
MRKLSNEMLIAILDKHVECESANEAEMIDFIREILSRRLWLGYGSDSMFDFMTRSPMRGQTIRNTQAILNEALDFEVKTRPKIRVQRDGSVRVEMTFSKEDWEVIARAKDVVSHSVPSGELTAVLSYCARFTLAKKDPSTSLREVKVRQSQGVSRSSRRYVFQRDKSCRHFMPYPRPVPQRVRSP